MGISYSLKRPLLSACFIAGLLFWAHCLNAQVQSLDFKSLTIKEGLSQGTIYDILQDHNGFIWIATRDGLNKYDGYQVTKFRNELSDSTSLPDNGIKSLYEDSKDRLWVGTESEGIARYNRKTGNFQSYQPKSPPGQPKFPQVNVICEDDNGRLWIGGIGDELLKFNPDNGSFERFKLLSGDRQDDFQMSPFHFVSDILKNENGNLWITTLGFGLYLFDPDKEEILHHFSKNAQKGFRLPNNNLNTLAIANDGLLWIGTNDGFFSLKQQKRNNSSVLYETSDLQNPGLLVRNSYCDSNGILWLGTNNKGLARYNPSNQSFQYYKAHPEKQYGLNMNTINAITIDRSGVFWVGTNGRGVNWFSLNKKFTHYPEIPSRKHGILNNSIRAIHEDHKGHIWIGSYTGIDRYDPTNQEVKGYPYHPHDTGYKYNKNVYSIYEDSDHRLWIGTEGGGLYRLNKETESFKNYGGELDKRYPFKFIFDITEGPNGNLWLATEQFLVQFDPETENFEVFLDTIQRTRIQHFQHIEKDQKGRFWIACKGGYIIFNPSNKHYKLYDDVTKDSTGLMSERILSINQTAPNTMWMATNGGGIARITLDSRQNPQKYQHFTRKDGLPNNVAYGILQDDSGDLWISTNQGLAKMIQRSGDFLVFKEGDGLQGNEFNAGAFHKTSSGEMFFGGIMGLNSFDPSNIRKNQYVPPVILTGITKLGAEIEFNQSVSELKTIEVNHDENVLTFNFAALAYNNPANNQYAYKLVGFRDEWEYTGNQRSFTFTNLDPGEYTLKVKASNNDGIWNETGTSLQLRVIPPFWQTSWFYFLVGILLIGGIGLSYYWRVKAIKKRQSELERLVEKRTSELQKKNEELANAKAEVEKAAQAKSDFLASMSHEIRTPMNAVVGMADLLIDTPLNKEQQDYLETIQKSGDSLLTIINDILDLSKIEAGKLALEQTEFELWPAVEDVVNIFAPKAQEKQIDLGCWIDERLPEVITGDITRLKQVLTNLLSNALKFTETGYVGIEVTLPEGMKEAPPEGQSFNPVFLVKDTGIGIDENHFHKLFQNFSQIDASTTRKYGGTGLGLAICDKLVKMMNGHIDFQSKVNEGTTFTFDVEIGVAKHESATSVHNKPRNLEGKQACLISGSRFTPRILEGYLKELDVRVANFTLDNEDEIHDQTTLTKANIVFWDPDNLDQEQMDSIKESKATANQPYWISVSFKPSQTSEGYQLKKPVKRKKLWYLLKQIFEGIPEEQAHDYQESELIDSKLGAKYPLRILLVEDNYMNQRVMLRHLSKLGYFADIAEDGREAVEKSQNADFDLILMDIQMPEMDGLEAMHRIRQVIPEGKTPKIIALTANALENDRQRYLNEGMDDCMIKPIKIKEFQEKIKEWFGSGEG